VAIKGSTGVSVVVVVVVVVSLFVSTTTSESCIVLSHVESCQMWIRVKRVTKNFIVVVVVLECLLELVVVVFECLGGGDGGG